MESLVYEDSPLADYLEGEGERDQHWTPQQVGAEQDPISPSSNFAPRGTSTLQSRIRNKLPAPLEIRKIHRTGTLGQIHNACSAAVSTHIRRSDNERFLEQFGYVIVASQLLDEYSATTYTSNLKSLSNASAKEVPTLPAIFGLTGAIVTAATSFSIVWLIHWSRTRTGPGLNLKRIAILLILLPVVGLIFYAYARRQWLKFVRHQAIQAASSFVGNAQSFDSVTSASVQFIQEVELVSRGYRISTPLPPVSRLEESSQVRRCLRLRRTVSECLFNLLNIYTQAQHSVRLLADTANLEKYYDNYEVSTADLREAESTLAERGLDDQYSLRSLRTLFGRLYTMRKGILCCLLALQADGSGSDIAIWSAAVEEMRDLAVATGDAMAKITSILNEQDREIVPPSPVPSTLTGRDTLRAQFRRLNSLSQGIRALHAKMHVMREETDASMDQEGQEQDIGASLMAQYESIGADIRGLLQEWEAGKSALLTSIEPGGVDRFSRASSDLRSPLSPALSLGGVTAVDGSPTAALMALNGESQLPLHLDTAMDAEEIFEAVALPTSRKRQSMTREERIARVKEDRARQAAAREKSDASTHMLRELETVIKHRPGSSKPQRITSI